MVLLSFFGTRFFTRIFAFFALAVLVFSALAFDVRAQDNSQGDPKNYPAWISQIEGYMNSLKSMEAKFEQTNPDGSKSRGVLYLKRPDKFRLEYDDPKGVLFLSSGTFLTYVDQVKKEATQYPLFATPASLLTREFFKVEDEEVVLQQYDAQDDFYYIKVANRDAPEEGSVVLFFWRDPFVLVQWSVVDSQNNVTQVRLYDQVVGGSYPDKIFVFVPPQDWQVN